MTTNIEKIKQYCDKGDTKGLAKFLQRVFDEHKETFGCFSCTTYDTHHYPDLCGDCYWLNIKGSIAKWLENEVEKK